MDWTHPTPADVVTTVSAVLTPAAVVLVALINYRMDVAAKKAASQAHASAQLAGEEARKNAVMLYDLAKETRQVHTIVNSAHTALLKLVANLTKRIAAENPTDAGAQADAKAAFDAATAADTYLHGVELEPPHRAL